MKESEKWRGEQNEDSAMSRQPKRGDFLWAEEYPLQMNYEGREA